MKEIKTKHYKLAQKDEFAKALKSLTGEDLPPPFLSSDPAPVAKVPTPVDGKCPDGWHYMAETNTCMKGSSHPSETYSKGVPKTQATGKAFGKLGQEDRGPHGGDAFDDIVSDMRKEYDFDDDYGMEPWEEEDVDERHDVMEPHEDEYVLSFDMEGDYLTRGREVTDDVQGKFKDFYSGSGSGGSGYDFSLTGPEEALEVIKKYVEDKYTHEVMDSSIDLIDW